jgi:hypothetical protein
VEGQSDLFQIILALSAPRRFARGLHGRKQQRNKHGDHGYRHEQFNDREAPSLRVRSEHGRSFEREARASAFDQAKRPRHST